MKDVSQLKFPDDVRYVESHEWVKEEGGRARIGITDYAQDQLGDIVFVELPAVGKTFADVFLKKLNGLLRRGS